MRYMLDTNTLSDIARGKSETARLRLHEMADTQICISSITFAEALFGLERRPLATAVREAVLRFVESLTVLAWRDKEARVYGVLRARLQASGIAIASLDLLIAAHAISRDAVLVTRDKGFRHIPDLKMENWATDLQ